MLNSLLPTVENESSVTVKVLRAVPDDRSSYKPDENAKTAFELAWHMATAEARFLSAVAAQGFSFDPYPKAANMSEVMDFYTSHFEKNLAALKTLTGEQAATIVDFRGMFQLPAVMFLMFNNNHMIHHRGQLSTYLRPMGSAVPAIYGESYDSAEAKKAAQTA